jgi:CHAD domain-containing protein
MAMGGDVSEVATGARKAPPVALDARDSVQDAAVAVLGGALDHFEANLSVFHAGRTPESVHQMRVALRRLRAAIGLFRGALEGAGLEAARERAKALAEILGAARDWDVFHDRLRAGPADAGAPEPSFRALTEAVSARRASAYAAAERAMAGAKAKIFVIELRRTIETKDWTLAPGAGEVGSARDFARKALTRLRKGALKKGRNLANLPPDGRHRARIALKKARYGAEFFESLFASHKDAAAFSAALAKLQDGLGAFNDLATASALLDEIDAADDGTAARASGFVRGWFAHAAQSGATHARKSEKRLKELEPFWL